MSNIFENNHNKIDLALSFTEFWDLGLSKEIDPIVILNGSNYYDDNLISYININDDRCYSGNTLYNNIDYKWINTFNTGLTLDNIGITGIDNGLIQFNIDDILNDDFYNLITGSTYSTPSGETRLILHQITGNTGIYIYPMNLVDDLDGNSVYFNGGFYQGIFKSNNDYQILPIVVNDEISFDFVLKPDFTSTILTNTLNNKYPNNKGFFFYMGVRSENKFWYDYNKDISEVFEIVSTGNTTPLNSGTTLTTNDWVDITLQGVYIIPTDNKYLLFNRTSNGLTTQTFDENKSFSITGVTNNTPNLYLYMNRTNTGYTTQNVDQIMDNTLFANINDDIVKNQIGFRIKDDGSIGYRTIIGSCDNGVNFTVEEEYSDSGVTQDGVWSNITVRMIMSEHSVCGNSNRKYNLMFYVDSKLVLTSKELPELIFKLLNEREVKQEGVAYNISIGGGSQGLADMVGFNDDYSRRYLLPIEQYFAGSFIGNISKFRIFEGKYDYSKIKNNYNYEFGINENITYIEPTIDLILSGNTFVLPETSYFREIGNTYTLIDGTIQPNRILNTPIKPLTGYKLYYYPNGSNQTQLNGLFSVPGTGGSINEYIHNDLELELSGLTSIKYLIEVFDTYKISTGTKQIKTINFDNMIFYGNTDSIPTTSLDIRNLPNRIFNSGTVELILETGNINKIFVVAVPVSKEIDLILDENAMFADITRTYIGSTMMVSDAGGLEIEYNVYIMANAIPYTRNHNHKITFV